MSSLKKRVMLVGDSGCGKSALAFKLKESVFLDIYEPTGFDDFQTEVWTPLGLCDLTILDTSGSHEDQNLRAKTYKSCDAVLVCFDLSDQTSLSNTEHFWIPEVKKHCPHVPLYIVGCKRDARCEESCTCGYDCCTHTEEDLLQVVQKTGAVAYAECSSLTQDNGVEELFQVVIETSNQRRRNSAQKMMSKIKKQSRSVRKHLSL